MIPKDAYVFDDATCFSSLVLHNLEGFSEFRAVCYNISRAKKIKKDYRKMRRVVSVVFIIVLLLFSTRSAGAYEVNDIFAPAGHGEMNIVKAYLIWNPDMLNSRDDCLKWTPLFYAARNGHLDMVKFLVSSGALVDITDKTGATPLIWCTKHKSVTEFLISSGADPCIITSYGETPLHAAVREGCCDVAEYLIYRGANVNMKNKYNETPLKIAQKLGRRDMAQLLRLYGAHD